MASSKFRFETVTDGIIEWFNGPEWDELAYQEFLKAEGELEFQMQQDAPWTDRSGDARRGLRAVASNENGIITMTLSHTVDYGYWLEVIQNGRFAIIGPTLEQEARRITYNAIRRIRYARK